MRFCQFVPLCSFSLADVLWQAKLCPKQHDDHSVAWDTDAIYAYTGNGGWCRTVLKAQRRPDSVCKLLC